MRIQHGVHARARRTHHLPRERLLVVAVVLIACFITLIACFITLGNYELGLEPVIAGAPQRPHVQCSRTGQPLALIAC